MSKELVDLVESLRGIDRAGVWHTTKPKNPHPICAKAADAIESLSRLPDREEVARVIDPEAFRHWQQMYDYCIRGGDGHETATKFAEWAGGPECAAALEKADRILAMMEGRGDDAC